MLQTDSLLSRLKALKERIDATEAHVTLDLDHRRNQIVSFNLVSLASLCKLDHLSAGLCMLSCYVCCCMAPVWACMRRCIEFRGCIYNLRALTQVVRRGISLFGT